MSDMWQSLQIKDGPLQPLQNPSTQHWHHRNRWVRHHAVCTENKQRYLNDSHNAQTKSPFLPRSCTWIIFRAIRFVLRSQCSNHDNVIKWRIARNMLPLRNKYSALKPRELVESSVTKLTSILLALLATSGGFERPQNRPILFAASMRSPLNTETWSYSQLMLPYSSENEWNLTHTCKILVDWVYWESVNFNTNSNNMIYLLMQATVPGNTKF